MINNIYYILKRPEEATSSMLKFCVGKEETQRRSIDGKLMVVKLPTGSEIPPLFKPLITYTHEEILKVMAGVEWSSDI